MGKIVDLTKLEKIVYELKKEGKKIVTTNGVFDILHIGHVKLLAEAKKLGDVLIVGVNSDRSARENKGNKRPINNEESRVGIIASLEYVDYAFIFDEKTPNKWIEKLKPNIHVKGSDRTIEQIVEKESVEKNGGKVMLLDVIEGVSTSKTIEKILGVYSDR
ncbi:MAG TPA: D-glycero-beta-D-manno-heptose 1-phosphate adenylyltransferase [Thermoplasmata archaeon]|nr:D-glycero-beta-D-manno-heptose 1-phosphate adenylyltransferase [Thermoplasmata archaeon]